MIIIRKTADLEKVRDPQLRDWLRCENPFLQEQAADGSEWGPDNTGFLMLLEETDDIHDLSTGIEAVRNLTEIDSWEWADFDSGLDMWNAVAILGDNFGLAFAIPGILVCGTPLQATLEAVESAE